MDSPKNYFSPESRKKLKKAFGFDDDYFAETNANITMALELERNEEEDIEKLKYELCCAIPGDDLEKFKNAFEELDEKSDDLVEEVDLPELLSDAIHASASAIANFLLDDAILTGIDEDLRMGLLAELTSKNAHFINDLCLQNGLMLSFLDYINNERENTLIEILIEHGKYKSLTFEDFCDLKSFDIESDELIHYLTSRDECLEFLKILLKRGVQVPPSAYEKASERIRAFLDYKPGRGERSIYEYHRRRHVDLTQLARMILDEADTSSDESSDEEETKKDVDLKAAKVKDKKLLFRGNHFGPRIFSQESRRAYSTAFFSPQIVSSVATANAAGYRPDEKITDGKEFKAAAKKTKRFFETLKNSADKKEAKKPSRNKKQYESLLYRFIQAYVMDYNYLFNQGKVSSVFGAESKENPLVSTSEKFDRALHYASGLRTDERRFSQNRLDPHYRRSTGKCKHTHLGFTDIFAVDQKYLAGNAHSIQQLIKEGKICISHLYQFECEVAFESFIPRKFHQQRVVLKLPRFDMPWSKEFQTTYGISKKMFTQYQNGLKTVINKRGDEYVALVNRITKKIIAQQQDTFKRLNSHTL